MVGVAQLVEPRIVIPVVVGSSPIIHPSHFARFVERSGCVQRQLTFSEVLEVRINAITLNKGFIR